MPNGLQTFYADELKALYTRYRNDCRSIYNMRPTLDFTSRPMPIKHLGPAKTVTGLGSQIVAVIQDSSEGGLSSYGVRCLIEDALAKCSSSPLLPSYSHQRLVSQCVHVINDKYYESFLVQVKFQDTSNPSYFQVLRIRYHMLYKADVMKILTSSY